jgi:hypothetical protein
MFDGLAFERGKVYDLVDWFALRLLAAGMVSEAGEPKPPAKPPARQAKKKKGKR